jgi:DNA-binding NarL/FixJ family response regulator
VIASDVRLYRESLALLLARDAELCVAALFDNGASVSRLGDEIAYDVLLLDMRMTDSRDACAILRIRRDRPRVVGFAVEETPAGVISCAELGLSTYVPCDGNVEQLVEAVKGAMAGRLDCPPHIASSLFERLRELSTPLSLSPGAARLTRREREIVALIGREFSNKEIAWELHLSPATVKNHIHHILEKLGVHRRSQIGLHLRAPA